MSEEEYDYMSENFVSESKSNDIRPGLIQSRSLLRKHSILKKKEKYETQKPVSVLERENLENGLQKPLDADNKGYALLEKMGFKPGMGLGKEGTGRSEPVQVEIKRNRAGLGVKAVLLKMRTEIERKWKESKKNAPTLDGYRSRIIDEANERHAGIDLYKSQKSCHSLDMKQGINEPLENWFWPSQASEVDKDADDKSSEHEEEFQISVQDKLEMLTLYLRRTYFYCVWCGTTYEDEKDIQQECPGPTRNDH